MFLVSRVSSPVSSRHVSRASERPPSPLPCCCSLCAVHVPGPTPLRSAPAPTRSVLAGAARAAGLTASSCGGLTCPPGTTDPMCAGLASPGVAPRSQDAGAPPAGPSPRPPVPPSPLLPLCSRVPARPAPRLLPASPAGRAVLCGRPWGPPAWRSQLASVQPPRRGPRGAAAASGLWVSSFAGPPRPVALTPAPRGPSPPGRVCAPRHCLPWRMAASLLAGGEEGCSRLPRALALWPPVLSHGGGERV